MPSPVFRRLLPALLAAVLALPGCGAPLPAQAHAQPVLADGAAVQRRTGVPDGAAATQVVGGPLVFVGGGEDQDDVMRAWAKLAGGGAAPLVIVPLASSDPAKSGQAYVDYLGELGFRGGAFVVPRGEPTAAERATLTAAGGLFFSGGDQARILAGLSPAWRGLVRDAWRRGAAIGGTSAGAMVWGATAIMGGEPMATGWHGEDPAHPGIRLAGGLGLVPRLVVDTHFAERGRLPRIAYALAKQRGGVALGVDPQTAAIVRPDGQVQVAGRGTVTLLRMGAGQAAQAPLSLRDMRLELLSAGDAAEVGPLTGP